MKPFQNTDLTGINIPELDPNQKDIKFYTDRTEWIDTRTGEKVVEYWFPEGPKIKSIDISAFTKE